MKFNNHNSKVIIGHEMKTDRNKFCNSFIHASLHSFAGSFNAPEQFIKTPNGNAHNTFFSSSLTCEVWLRHLITSLN